MRFTVADTLYCLDQQDLSGSVLGDRSVGLRPGTLLRRDQGGRRSGGAVLRSHRLA
ncbi:MAG: hypothetical protein JO249_08325 [Acidobacteria bacterium]|nr:hypothetical protein [Acidobacteriota bacterium]